ncbi:molybdopterin-binding protein [Deferrisoma palaeochoriense]
MRRKEIPLEEAVGLPLSHDLTQIDAAAGFKGPRFRRGHVVRPEDLPVLRAMGRAHLTVLELDPEEVHEDRAALRMSARCAGTHVTVEGPAEGRCTLVAAARGLASFDPDSVHRVNEDPDWIFATVSPNAVVDVGNPVAAFRVVPLAIQRSQLERALSVAPVVSVLPFRKLRVALVVTGRELADGLVRDAFAPKLRKKLARYGADLTGGTVVSDDPRRIAEAVRRFWDEGAEVVLCTGGMSVDADDRTPAAIRSVCSEVRFRGVPVLPGSMLMLGTRGHRIAVGAPACVVHDEWTSLDPLLGLLFAGVIPTPQQVRRWGVGGLCRRCPVCHFPYCGFAERP